MKMMRPLAAPLLLFFGLVLQWVLLIVEVQGVGDVGVPRGSHSRGTSNPKSNQDDSTSSFWHTTTPKEKNKKVKEDHIHTKIQEKKDDETPEWRFPYGWGLDDGLFPVMNPTTPMIKTTPPNTNRTPKEDCNHPHHKKNTSRSSWIFGQMKGNWQDGVDGLE